MKHVTILILSVLTMAIFSNQKSVAQPNQECAELPYIYDCEEEGGRKIAEIVDGSCTRIHPKLFNRNPRIAEKMNVVCDCVLEGGRILGQAGGRASVKMCREMNEKAVPRNCQ